MKLLIAGGNMATNNVMQIRIMPPPTANASNANPLPNLAPRLIRASYGEPQTAPAGEGSDTSITGLMQGMLGYSQGRGAQALGQVPVVSQSGPPPPPPPVVAGTVKDGKCSYVMRAGTTTWVSLNPSDSIYAGDTIDTASTNYCQTYLVMADGTSWTLAPSTRWVVQNYEYQPSLSQLVAEYGGLQGVYSYLHQVVNNTPPDVILEGCGGEHFGVCGSIGIRGTEFIWKVDSTAKTMEVDLISGAVAVTPAGSTTPGPTINAPMQIEVTPQGVQTLPLTQDQYNSIKAQNFPAPVPTS
jgi:hypothetical protein